MIKKGSMITLKKIIGGIILTAGISLIIIPVFIVPILCDNKIIFGTLLIIAGYFHIISGRQQ